MGLYDEILTCKQYVPKDSGAEQNDIGGPMFDVTRKPISVQDFKNDIRLVRLAKKPFDEASTKEEKPSTEENRPSYERSTHVSA